MPTLTPNGLAKISAGLIGVIDENNPSLTATQNTNILTLANFMIDAWATHDLLIPAHVRELYPYAAGEGAFTLGVNGRFNMPRPLSLEGVSVYDTPPATRTIATLTSASGVATATQPAHGFVTGDVVMILGASPIGYNGAQVVTVIDANSYYYRLLTPLTSPAAGPVYGIDARGDDRTLERPLSGWTREAWRADSQKGQTHAWPTAYFYDPTPGLGVLYLAPVPTQASTLVLYVKRPLSELDLTALDTAIVLAPGYARALVFNLAVEIAPSYGVNLQGYPTVVKTATDTLNDLKRQNDQPVILSTGVLGEMFGRGGGYDIETDA